MISLFQNFHINCGEITIPELVNHIKSGEYQKQIEAIRAAFHQGNKNLGDALKKELLGFTPSGTFRNERKASEITDYNKFIVIDIDKITAEQVEQAKLWASLAPYTHLAFTSPSGLGLKILVKVNSDKTQHKAAFNQLKEYYETALQLVVDPSGKDLSRLCFMSYDPDLIYKPNADVFQVKIEEEKPIYEKQQQAETTAEQSNVDWKSTFQQLVDFTNKISTYADGNRNNYIHQLACNCNRAGVPQELAEQLAHKQFDLEASEITKSISSAYKHNDAEFAKFATSAKPENETKEAMEQKVNDILRATPCIPESVYASLPTFLSECTEVFLDPRERDVFLISSLAIISGCLSEMTGVYFNNTTSANLFSFVLAPSASGKGSMSHAKRLGDKIHKALVEESKTNQADYKKELVEYKRKTMGIKKNISEQETPQEPVEPPFKLLYVPANSSTAKVYYHLQNNGGKAIICETEADALGTVFKNDWGGYSDLLRRAYHNESVSISRKTDNQYFEIEYPRISIVLTGTPNQMLNIIRSAEDGLFSRFMFYTFSSPPIWKSPAPNPSLPNLTDFFAHKSSELQAIYDYYEQNPTSMLLTQEQWAHLDEYFQAALEEGNDLISSEFTSVIKRQGTMVFRLCLIFSALRKLEYGLDDTEITCEDQDFKNAMDIINTVNEHSMTIFTNLPGAVNEFKITKTNRKDQFYNTLPQEFKRKEAIDIAKQFHIAERTVDQLLNKTWLGTKIQKVDTGVYTKI
jgi:hypothetical protein